MKESSQPTNFESNENTTVAKESSVHSSHVIQTRPMPELIQINDLDMRDVSIARPSNPSLPALIKIEEPAPYAKLSPKLIKPIPSMQEICDYYKSTEKALVTPISGRPPMQRKVIYTSPPIDRSLFRRDYEPLSISKENIKFIWTPHSKPIIIPKPKFRIVSKDKQSKNPIKKAKHQLKLLKASPAEIIKQKMKENYIRNRHAAQNQIYSELKPRQPTRRALFDTSNIKVEKPCNLELVKVESQSQESVTQFNNELPEVHGKNENFAYNDVLRSITAPRKSTSNFKCLSVPTHDDSDTKSTEKLACPKCSKFYIKRSFYNEHILQCCGTKQILQDINNNNVQPDPAKALKINDFTQKLTKPIKFDVSIPSISLHHTRSVSRALKFD